jgi:diguanylate cyclase (GGDEF)-like protein
MALTSEQEILFHHWPTPSFWIDDTFHLRQIGDFKAAKGQFCYAFFWGRSEPCKECRLQEKVSFRRSGPCKWHPEYQHVTYQYRPFGGGFLVTVEDKTALVGALAELKASLQRSEEQLQKEHATAVMLKHKFKQLERAHEDHQRLLMNQPAGLLLVDHSFQLQFVNHRVRTIVSEQSGSAKAATTCHELLYERQTPCPSCPLHSAGPPFAKYSGQRQLPSGQTAYLTETFQTQGDSFLIAINDTTRTIALARNIQQDQLELNAVNQTLNDVMAFSAFLQKIDQREKLLHMALELLKRGFFSQDPGLLGFLRKNSSDRHVEMADLLQGSPEDLAELVQLFTQQGESGLAEAGFSVLALPRGTHLGEGVFFVQTVLPEGNRLNILKVFLSSLSSLEENLALRADLERQAHVDGLTGAYNRRYLERRLEEVSVHHRRTGVPFAVLVMDINGLKAVNDQIGHEAGDQMIIASGRFLLSHSRKEDVLARFGGDEFVFLLPGTTRVGGWQFLKRLKDGMTSLSFPLPGKADEQHPIHISMGVASTEEADWDKLFHLADERMYDDKQRYYQSHQRYR